MNDVKKRYRKEAKCYIDDISIKSMDFIDFECRKSIRRFSYENIHMISDYGFEKILRESCEYIEGDFFVINVCRPEDKKRAMEAFERQLPKCSDLAKYKVKEINNWEFTFWIADKVLKGESKYKDFYDNEFKIKESLFVLRE